MMEMEKDNIRFLSILLIAVVLFIYFSLVSSFHNKQRAIK